MKLLEKMASQEFPDDYNSNEEFIDKEDLRDAYIAGFKAARELTAKLIEEGETIGSDCGIRKIGEEEV